MVSVREKCCFFFLWEQVKCSCRKCYYDCVFCCEGLWGWCVGLWTLFEVEPTTPRTQLKDN